MSARSALNVSLTPEFTDFVAGCVATGRYKTASEVVREALRRFQEDGATGSSEAGKAFLLRLSDCIGQTRNPHRILAEAAFLLGSHLEADRAGYCEVSDDGEYCTIHDHWVAGDMPSVAGSFRLRDFGAQRLARLRKGETVCVTDASTDAIVHETADVAARVQAMAIQASMSVPLVKDGKLCAVLFVHQRTPREWTDEEQQLTHEVAERTSAAVGRAHAEIALAQSEARFRALAEILPQMIWAADAQGNNIYCNARFAEFVGLSNGLQGRHWAELVHPEDRAVSAELRRQTLISGQDFERQHRLRRADGVYRWVLARAVALRNAEGEIENWYGSSTDITEIVEAREVLKQSHDQLERLVAERTHALEDAARELAAEMHRREEMQSNVLQVQKLEAMGQLTSSVVHDFNNVLQAISGSYSLIRNRSDSEMMLKIVDHGEKALERASHLIAQLMNFIRREKLTPQVLNLAAFLPATEDLICHAVGPQVRCRYDIAPDVAAILADPFQLEVALLNLAVNARDAMDRSGEIVISAHNLLPGDLPEMLGLHAYVAIGVQDRGKGMPPDVMARATEQFFTTKPVGEGTGLGLPMVQGFAARLGGAVRIQSDQGAGTLVEIILPRAPVDEAAGSFKASDLPDPSLHGDATILLVDDDEHLRQLVAAFLRDLGYTVLACGSTETAAALVSTLGHLDLLLTDIVMAGATGPMLAMRLRTEFPGLPVQFITGGEIGAELAGESVLLKPFTFAALGAAILERLGRWTPPDSGGGDRLLLRLRTPSLRQFYLNWQTARVEGVMLPRLATLDPVRFGLGPQAFTIVVEQENPLTLRYASVGHALSARLGRRLDGALAAGGAEPVDDVLGNAAAVYRRCARNPIPLYQSARFDFGDAKPMHLERLILPVSENGATITHLVGIAVFAEPEPTATEPAEKLP